MLKYWFIFLLQFLSTTFLAQEEAEKQNNKKKNSRLIAGYKIGGHTYFGLNYEYKFNKHTGIHVGLGISGYAAGVKLHLNDCVECPAINISYKDGNFGGIGTIGAELCFQLISLKRNNLGLYTQFGYGYIAHLSNQYIQKFYNNNTPPEGIFVFGIGLTW